MNQKDNVVDPEILRELDKISAYVAKLPLLFSEDTRNPEIIEREIGRPALEALAKEWESRLGYGVTVQSVEFTNNHFNTVISVVPPPNFVIVELSVRGPDEFQD